MLKSVNPAPGSLREEIGLMRLCIETRMNQCKTDVDLMANCMEIGTLVGIVERLVKAELKLQEKAAKRAARLKAAIPKITAKVVDAIMAELG